MIRALRTIFCICAISLTLLVSGCTVCHEQITGQSDSPDGRWNVKTTFRDCGNTNSETVLVYLQPASATANKLGEVIAIVRHEHEVKLAWQDNAIIIIDCGKCGADFRMHRESAHGIRIRARD